MAFRLRHVAPVAQLPAQLPAMPRSLIRSGLVLLPSLPCAAEEVFGLFQHRLVLGLPQQINIDPGR